MSDEEQRTRFVESLQCPSCGLLNAATNRFCTGCGSPVAPAPASAGGPGDAALDAAASGPAAGLGVAPLGTDNDRLTHPMPDRLTASRASGRTDPDSASVTHILSGDRREQHPFQDTFTVGRETGDLTVADDPYLSGEHLTVRRVGNRYVLTDLDSSNGTFIRIRSEVELRPGDEVLIGGQVFRFLV